VTAAGLAARPFSSSSALSSSSMRCSSRCSESAESDIDLREDWRQRIVCLCAFMVHCSFACCHGATLYCFRPVFPPAPPAGLPPSSPAPFASCLSCTSCSMFTPGCRCQSGPTLQPPIPTRPGLDLLRLRLPSALPARVTGLVTGLLAALCLLC
jgi:hypothetical protein